MIAPHKLLTSALAAVAFLACSERPYPAAPDAPDNSTALSTITISGTVETGAGVPLCDAFENDSKFVIGLYSEDFETTQEVQCPDNSFSFAGIPSGDYWVTWERRRLDPEPDVRVPQFWTTGPVTLSADGSEVLRLSGVRPVHGRAIFRHDANEFARLLVYDSDFVFDNNIEAARFISDGDGDWVDPVDPDAELFLQAGHSYTAYCDGGLGTKTSIRAFDVPDVQNLTCRSEPSEFVRISHDATGLILSPEPGTLNSMTWDPYFVGYGWGVQFPDSGRPSTSRDENLLFEASLAVALDNGVILSGGHTGDCTQCDDFDNVLNLGVKDIGDGRLRTTWYYDDENSGEAAGLSVRQRSYDGVTGNHVFFHYSFENRSAETLIFNPGMYVDWDIGDFDDNDGGTEIDGQLMYATDPDGNFPFIGTLILNRESAGNYFVDPEGDIPVNLQADALRGEVRRESVTAADVAYFHSSTPIVLRPGRSEGLWMVVLAAESLPELLDAAETARTEWTAESSVTSASVRASDRFESTGDMWLPVPQRVSGQPAMHAIERPKKRQDQPSSRTN